MVVSSVDNVFNSFNSPQNYYLRQNTLDAIIEKDYEEKEKNHNQSL